MGKPVDLEQELSLHVWIGIDVAHGGMSRSDRV